jgi:hypothetical protein
MFAWQRHFPIAIREWPSICLDVLDLAIEAPYYSNFARRSGEIGIRTRLKIWREQSHVGSSPTSGTKKKIAVLAEIAKTAFIFRASLLLTAIVGGHTLVLVVGPNPVAIPGYG